MLCLIFLKKSYIKVFGKKILYLIRDYLSTTFFIVCFCINRRLPQKQLSKRKKIKAHHLVLKMKHRKKTKMNFRVK